jgi:uncharacterized protein YkwD
VALPRLLRTAVLAAVLAVALCAGAGSSSALATRGHRAEHHGGVHRHPCANANLRPTATNLNLIRAATLCLIDNARAAHGEHSLRLNRHLDRAAQTHTASMASNNYFQHFGPGGQTPVSRMRAAGYIGRRVGYEVGENIAWGTLWDATPRVIVSAWMRSAGHRANILDRRYRDTGIGISPHAPASLAHGQAGAVYTQDFGVIIRG